MKKGPKKGDQDRIKRGKEKFLKILENTANMSFAARQIKVSNVTIWNWRQDDPDFDRAVNEHRFAAVQKVEDSMFENAINVHDDEGNVLKRANFMDGIAILKAYRPDLYGDKKTIEVQGKKELIQVIPAFVEDAKLIDDEAEGE